MKLINKVLFSLFLLVSLLYLFIIISPKIFKNYYPFGIRFAIVQTGSMSPTININDFIILKKTNDIKVNDIVSYKEKTSDTDVLHRVIQINDNEVITKGDANNTPDEKIDKSQINAVYVKKIKYLGNIISFIKKPIVFSITITIFFILLVLPNINFIKTKIENVNTKLKNSKRKKKNTKKKRRKTKKHIIKKKKKSKKKTKKK